MAYRTHEHHTACVVCGEPIVVLCRALLEDDGECDERIEGERCGLCEPEPTAGAADPARCPRCGRLACGSDLLGPVRLPGACAP
jgi:hypothetical protein